MDAVPAGWRLTGPSHAIRELAFDAGLGTVVLFCQGADARQRELWAWRGDRFARVAEGLLPGYQYGGDLHSVTVVSAPGRPGPLLAGILRDDRIVLVARDQHERERVLRIEAETAGASRLVIRRVCVLGPDVLAVKADGTVYRAEGDVLVPVADPLFEFPPDKVVPDQMLYKVAADPVGGRLVAVDKEGRGYTFSIGGAGWQPDGGHQSRLSEASLAWNPLDQRVEMLRSRAGGLMSTGPIWLHGWDEPDTGPPPERDRLLPFGYGYQMVFDEAAGEWVVLGTARVWRCRPGGP